jgi:hypothetical protein
MGRLAIRRSSCDACKVTGSYADTCELGKRDRARAMTSNFLQEWRTAHRVASQAERFLLEVSAKHGRRPTKGEIDTAKRLRTVATDVFTVSMAEFATKAEALTPGVPRSPYSISGVPCGFLEMLAGYIAFSTAIEEHTFGMVHGLIERHQRGDISTPQQCVAVREDTGGKVRIGTPAHQNVKSR